MPFDFPSFPAHIQNQVIQKMNVYDFITFGKASKEATSVAKSGYFSISENVERVEFSYINKEINVRFVYSDSQEDTEWLQASKLPPIHFVDQTIVIKDILYYSFSKKLAKFFRTAGTTNSKMVLSFYGLRQWRCQSAVFNELLKAADVRILYSKHDVPDFLRQKLPETIEKIEKNLPVEDDDPKKIDIHCCQIRCWSFNDWLEEWTDGQRTTLNMRTNAYFKICKEHILDGIEYEETEEDSVFMIKNGDRRLYCRIEETWFTVNDVKENV